MPGTYEPARSARRRVLLVSWAANLGGVATSLHARMQGLRLLGVECEKLFCWPGAGLAGFSHFNLHVTADPKEFAAIIQSGGYEAVSLVNSAFFLGALRQVGYQGKVVYEVRGLGPVMVKTCSEITSRDVRAILVPSRYVASLVGEFLADRQIPVHVIPDGINTRVFHPMRRLGRCRAGGSVIACPDRPVVLWVGRLDPNKNWPEMLEIAQLLVEAGRDLEFWVVADTNISPDVPVFQRMVQERGLDAHIRLFPCVPHRKMPYLYNVAARSGGCILSTSRSEGLQNSLLEGMACGCPVVTSAVGGNVELVTNGQTGRLYPPGQPRAAAECIGQLVEEETPRREMIQDGLWLVRTHYGHHRHASAFLQVLDQA